MLYPDMGEELAFHERLTCGGVPVPVSDSEARELLALLEKQNKRFAEVGAKPMELIGDVPITP